MSEDVKSWLGRRVQIVDGPSVSTGMEEFGIIICIDATDMTPSAWVKIVSDDDEATPRYRSCDLNWLVDIQTGDYGPSFTRLYDGPDHGNDDAKLIPKKVYAINEPDADHHEASV